MFLHTIYPQSVLLQFGPIKIYWYGVFIVVGILAAYMLSAYLLKKYGQRDIDLADLTLYLLIGGLLGARFFHVLSEYRYYSENPMNIFKIWHGGLWIYGALIGGGLGLWIYAGQKKFNFSKILFMLDVLAPGIIFAQSLGRWGNYFNQELYGLPTSLPWGIPISYANRVNPYLEFTYFHPAFLYESLWCLIVGIILLGTHYYHISQGAQKKAGNIFLWYLFLYSSGRFCFEFLRLDPVATIWVMRLTQIMAALIMLISIFLIIEYRRIFTN